MPRKYTLIKVSDGDYLLPTNDRTKVVRFCRYEENESTGADPSWAGTYWMAQVNRMPSDAILNSPDDSI